MYENLTILGQAAAGLGVLAGGVFAGWQSLQAKREAQKAKAAAHPVSNGWGTKVTENLERLVAGMDRLDRRQTAADEQRADMARRISVAGANARHAADQAAAVSRGLSEHLAEHTTEDSDPLTSHH